MTRGGVTATGLKETLAAIERLPATVTAGLKEVARRTSADIVDDYRRRLLSQTKARKTAASARVLDESDRKQFVANVPGDPADPEGLTGWLEYGTQRMNAKPSLRPAGDAQNDRYKREMASAAERLMKGALT